ncbi:guanylate kinase GUK1 [Acrasis kona]|uniref:guanylate kinase n=1 Tax=Acrasis kona TaxID=1008807 RepID=A0AAW2YZR3_9EUKA
MSASLRPIIICGASGVGKGTLISKLMENHRSKFGFSVSHTTRLPRLGEVDGVDYHFVTNEVFTNLIEKKAFVEYAHVHTKYYGTSIEAVKNVLASKCCILDIDYQGATQVKFSSDLNPVVIFVKAPNFEVLEQRLRKRGTETEDVIQVRLKNAIKEVEIADKNENNLFDVVLVNDNLERCLQEIKDVITKHIPTIKWD